MPGKGRITGWQPEARDRSTSRLRRNQAEHDASVVSAW